jgi:hypothetical protein
MQSTRVHARIIQHPFASLMQGARLDSFFETEQDLILDVHGLQVQTSELFEQDGQIVERVAGTYIPMRLHFSGVSELHFDDFFINLAEYPADDPCRTIVHFLSWRRPERKDIYYRIGLQGPVYAGLHFFASHVDCESLDKPSHPVCIERDWSPAPPMPQRLVPRPKHLYMQFGGDPITIQVNGKVRHRKLFIGELSIQPKRRPQVDAVLNLGEQSSRWAKGPKLHPNDRAINRGEGTDGMTTVEICQEARWAIERLEQNQSVLVHCVAGMNRSATVCCAILMLLEGLTAEAALERVRQHHPWARPDSHHWLALRWLEMNNKEK